MRTVGIVIDRETMQINSIVMAETEDGLDRYVMQPHQRMIRLTRAYHDTMRDMNELAACCGLPQQKGAAR